MTEKKFPYYLFSQKEGEKIEKTNLTEIEKELLFMLAIYDNGEKTNNQLSVLPYDFIKDTGYQNVISTYKSLGEKLGDHREKMIDYTRKSGIIFDWTAFTDTEIFKFFVPPCLEVVQILLELDKYDNMLEMYEVAESECGVELCSCIYDYKTGNALRYIINGIHHSYYRQYSDSPDRVLGKEKLYKERCFLHFYGEYLKFVEVESEDKEYCYAKRRNKDTQWQGLIYISMTEKGKELLNWYKENREELVDYPKRNLHGE